MIFLISSTLSIGNHRFGVFHSILNTRFTLKFSIYLLKLFIFWIILLLLLIMYTHFMNGIYVDFDSRLNKDILEQIKKSLFQNFKSTTLIIN